MNMEIKLFSSKLYKGAGKICRDCTADSGRMASGRKHSFF